MPVQFIKRNWRKPLRQLTGFWEGPEAVVFFTDGGLILGHGLKRKKTRNRPLPYCDAKGGGGGGKKFSINLVEVPFTFGQWANLKREEAKLGAEEAALGTELLGVGGTGETRGNGLKGAVLETGEKARVWVWEGTLSGACIKEGGTLLYFGDGGCGFGGGYRGVGN